MEDTAGQVMMWTLMMMFKVAILHFLILFWQVSGTLCGSIVAIYLFAYYLDR